MHLSKNCRLDSSAQQRNHLCTELLETLLLQSCTNLFHQRVIKIQVVHNRQSHSQHLVCLEQMTDVRSAVALADRAVALCVDWLIVQLVFGIVDVDNALPGEQVSVASVAA